MELAEALYKAGRFDEAQAAWKTVAQRGPDTTLQTRARYNMGNAAYQGGRLADAIASYQSALELDPAFEAAKANASAVSEELQKRMLPPDASQSEKDGDSEPEESDPASSDQERAPDSSDGTRSEAPQDDTPQSAAVDTGASEQDPGSGEQDPSAGEQDPGDPISYAAGESTPKQLSAEQARRLLDAVDEGVPHVVVGGNVDGAQDW
jgi:tetratricopeptide (TPR) repeat protein